MKIPETNFYHPSIEDIVPDSRFEVAIEEEKPGSKKHSTSFTVVAIPKCMWMFGLPQAQYGPHSLPH